MKTIKKILVAVGNEFSLNRCLNVAIPIAKGLDWGSKLLGSVSNGVVSNSRKEVLLVK
jgi:nucleotide-binding universal stress UspA family protein